jgi:Fe-S-cluster-containing dehydrogenase component
MAKAIPYGVRGAESETTTRCSLCYKKFREAARYCSTACEARAATPAGTPRPQRERAALEVACLVAEPVDRWCVQCGVMLSAGRRAYCTQACQRVAWQAGRPR